MKSVGSDEAGLVTNLWPFLTTVLGVVLGLMAEPVKAWFLRRNELKLAQREIYAELAGYIANMQRVARGLGHDNHLEEAPAAGFELSKRMLKSAPKFEVIQWYKANRLDLLLRIDRARGIRMLSEGIVALHEQANAPGRAFFGLAEGVLDLERAQERSLDGKLLRKYISAAHRDKP
jgi:hypothetical protein